jgi:hypothetical protein
VITLLRDAALVHVQSTAAHDAKAQLLAAGSPLSV